MKECPYTDERRDALENTLPSALEIALGLRPRAISRASGCKINTSANLSVLGGRNFHYTPPIVSVMTFFFPRRGCFDFRFWPAHCVL